MRSSVSARVQSGPGGRMHVTRVVLSENVGGAEECTKSQQRFATMLKQKRRCKKESESS